MSKFWNLKTSESSESREFGDGDSLKLVPLWSIVLAILVFVGSSCPFARSRTTIRDRCQCVS